MSDAIGPRRNYWEWTAKELEEEKQMLLQQVAALTTERDNLAALVGEMRAALTTLRNGYSQLVESNILTWGPQCETARKMEDVADAALARTPEQAGERRRALERCGQYVLDLHDTEWLFEDEGMAEAVDVLRRWRVDALAALEVQGAE